jgi:hypothetical protein
MHLLLLKKMMSEEASHCCHDAGVDLIDLLITRKKVSRSFICLFNVTFPKKQLNWVLSLCSALLNRTVILEEGPRHSSSC